MEKKIAMIVGAILLYIILICAFGIKINLVLLILALVYFIYKNNR